MTTKTDYHSIMELKKQYNPCNRGFVNQYEVNQIETILEIKERNNAASGINGWKCWTQ